MKPQTVEKKKPKRGIETMFRIISSNHQRLSEMADNKCHIMITVNSIILSVIITVLLRRIEEYTHLTIPSIFLLTINVTALIFALLASRPRNRNDNLSIDELKKHNGNLMFFGNFYRLSVDEYVSGMKAVMKDSDYLYTSLIRDVYSQGIVLKKKYRLLRISYDVFMYGMIGAVIVFVFASTHSWFNNV